MTVKIQIITDCKQCNLYLNCASFKQLTKSQQFVYKNSKIKENDILKGCELKDFNTDHIKK